MTVHITKLEGLPAILLEHVQPFKVPEDPTMALQEAAAFKKEQGTHIYRILDIRQIDMTFSDMMMAMEADRGKEGGAGDPDVTTIFIGSGKLVELGTKALAEQDQYGKGKVVMYTTTEEAIDYIQEQVGK